MMIASIYPHALIVMIRDRDSAVQYIMKAAVLNCRDEYGNTPLHLAAWNNSKITFKWLMEERADPVSIICNPS
jgi:ankyrin repeat protein